jgi:hypothetical protein
MALIIPNTFSNGFPAIANEVNENFAQVKIFVDALQTGANIDASAIVSAKIADSAVTQAKLADRAVGSAELDKLTLNPITDAYTLQLADAQKLVTLTKSTGFTVTIPLDSSVNFQIGDQINLLQLGVGQVTVAPVSGSVTLNSQGAKYKLNGQYAIGTLIKVSTNGWVLVGNLVA